MDSQELRQNLLLCGATNKAVRLVEGPAATCAEQDCPTTGGHLTGQEPGSQLFPLSSGAAGRERHTSARPLQLARGRRGC